MKNSVDLGICVFGAGVLLKHLDALEKEVEGVRSQPEDIEYIHRMRVASRRLRAAFPLFGGCLRPKDLKAWTAQIKKVTRALGKARDTDVQLEVLQDFYQNLTEKQYRPGISRLILRLSQERKLQQTGVDQAMQDLLDSGALEAMRARLKSLAELKDQVYLFTPALYEHSFNAITERLNAFLAYHEIVCQPEKVEELHEMRIAAKWLRYTLETFAPLYEGELKPFLQNIRKAQEMLGNIHDCDVWMQFLPEFLEKEREFTLAYLGHDRGFKRIATGINYFFQDRQAARLREYEDFTNRWQKWWQADLWSDLRKSIQVPMRSESE